MSTEDAFDQLYRRAINEDFDENPSMGGDLGGGDIGGGGLSGGDDFGGDDLDMGGDIDADPGHVGKVKEVVELLQQALEKLSSFEGEEEEEYEEYSDEEGSDEGEGFGDEDESPVTEEEVEAEQLGHALVDREKLSKGMTNPSNMQVKGAVPSVGKKATVPPAGKKADGKLSGFSDAGGKKMQGKGNMKVPASRTSTPNRFAFED